MSAINGNGYGDKHDWENKGTEQSSMPYMRSTLYVCRKCDQVFRHYYHEISDIFAAMESRGVKEECS